MNSPNPKQRYGDLKVPLALFPQAAIIYGALAFGEGAVKYGPYNWRDKAVEAMTYCHAAMRHLGAWIDGEEETPDSGLPHLGHVLACVAILVDAIEQGNLIDNRPIEGSAPRLLEKHKKEPGPPMEFRFQDAGEDELRQETTCPLEDLEPSLDRPPRIG